MTIVFGYPGLSVGASEPNAPRFVEHPRITRFEWSCQQCGGYGPGLMPEAHASGACEVTRTVVLTTGFMDGGGI